MNNLKIKKYKADHSYIKNSKGVELLKHKSQNLIFDSYQNAFSRYSHTLQVQKISLIIGQKLNLNLDLISAISLGHDVGHLPFSHNSQNVLNELIIKNILKNSQKNVLSEVFSQKNIGNSIKNLFYVDETDQRIFSHQKQSYHIYNKTKQVSLETKIGLLHNYTPSSIYNVSNVIFQKAVTKEMEVVKLADKIAWANQDIDNSIKYGFLNLNQLNKITISHDNKEISLFNLLGKTLEHRVDTFINDVVKTSFNSSQISLSPLLIEGLYSLISILFENVLESEIIKKRTKIIKDAITEIYNLELLKCSSDNKMIIGHRLVCDKIWNMKDTDVIEKYSINKSNKTKEELKHIFSL